MKRNFDVVVKDFDGRPCIRAVFKYHEDTGLPVMEDGPGGTKRQVFSHHQPMTLRLYALEALHGRWKGEEGLDHKESRKRMDLADKIAFSEDGVVELDNDEAQMILAALKHQGREHLVMGRMEKMLNSDPEPKPAE